MITVSSGQLFTDIDAYASALAYAELLQLMGEPSRVVLVGALNYSIPQELRQMTAAYSTEYESVNGESFVVVDVSELEHIAHFVDESKVSEIIDHHPGMEQYWAEKIGDKSDIEPIGAVCTQIYERWVRAGRLVDMSATNATLLAAGILDNTLNFTAKITDERDKIAYAELIKLAGLPPDWSSQYFAWCQRDIERNLLEALKTDAKQLSLAGYPDKLAVGQLAVWDAAELMSHRGQMHLAMQDFGAPWFVNILSIRQEYNYIVSEDGSMQELLTRLLGLEFIDGVAQTDRLWLRKEIMQAAIDADGVRSAGGAR